MLGPPDERTCLSIDGANLHATSRNLGLDIDDRNLLARFRAETTLLRA